MGNLAIEIEVRTEEETVIAELKAGSEEAYAWLIAKFNQPIYSLVYRLAPDPSEAADTVQEVFLKVFRGMKHFHGESTLKTWIYRIAIHEASNRRRWWFRHKAREVSIEPDVRFSLQEESVGICDRLEDKHESPFDSAAQEEVKIKVEEELRKIPEPFRTTVVLRDLEQMSYEDIAEITEVSLGTVKSRLTRGRKALRKRLVPYIREVGTELGLKQPPEPDADETLDPVILGSHFEVAS